jgi:predicted transcriptional regulator
MPQSPPRRPKTLLLSLHPQHAHRVFAGDKDVELRRIRPRVGSGDRLIVYATSPVKAIVGWCLIDSVIENQPSLLWRQVRNRCAVSLSDYQAYFSGARASFGIVLKRPTSLAAPISLRYLRVAIPGFTPPQCYRYMSNTLFLDLIGQSHEMAA